MKTICKFTDCDQGFDLDTKVHPYAVTGTGKYQTFAHATCAMRHTKISIALDKNQIKKLLTLLESKYNQPTEEIPVDMLDVMARLEANVL